MSGLQLARRYELSEELAPGALCRIIRGHDLMLRRPVVVKAIQPAQTDLYLEALRSTSALTHPAAVALYDAIPENGWLFLVQEAISGQVLSRYLRQGVPSERAVNLAIQLAQAVAYTHHRNMVHGDLTPAAVLVDRQATVRINNFGMPPDLDYFLAEGGADVQALIAEGTPQGDVLAIGLLLRQMLSSDEMAGSGNGTRQVRSDVQPELARLVERCTSPDVSDAIADAATLAIALEELGTQMGANKPRLSTDTPALLRAARDAEADYARWSSEQTIAGGQVAPGAVPLSALERGSHEVGSRFIVMADPGHSDVAATRAANEGDLTVPPRLRLPTRPLSEPLRYPDDRAYARERSAPSNGALGITLGAVLVVGIVLFFIFFVIGYLGPFPLGGH